MFSGKTKNILQLAFVCSQTSLSCVGWFYIILSNIRESSSFQCLLWIQVFFIWPGCCFLPPTDAVNKALKRPSDLSHSFRVTRRGLQCGLLIQRQYQSQDSIIITRALMMIHGVGEAVGRLSWLRRSRIGQISISCGGWPFGGSVAKTLAWLTFPSLTLYYNAASSTA